MVGTPTVAHGRSRFLPATHPIEEPKTSLTDMTVRALRPGTYFDAKTPAFGIRVGKHRRTWIVMRGRTRIRTTIGHYPDMKLAEARTEAKKLLSEVPTAKRPNLTFEKARDLFLEDNHADAKPRTKKEAERLLKKHFVGLNAKKLAEITDADIQKEIAPLARSEALHAFRAARTLFRWCVRPPRRYIHRAQPARGLSGALAGRAAGPHPFRRRVSSC